ncbi:hypothetical protein DM860_007498 [Cuscuta australis]|uniref:Uncharacterized protein n=1 Tax=Cuscuta australis TaxID=267555 RepID=A0A328E5D3_9ASTE|nr:hypothetical protein DM860_007498 [Cuscuta australis]
MGRKSGFSFLGLFRLKRSKREQQRRAEEEDDYYERNVGRGSVTKAYYRVWPSDEDRINWVADPQIDTKATAFLESKRRLFRGRVAADDA